VSVNPNLIQRWQGLPSSHFLQAFWQLTVEKKMSECAHLNKKNISVETVVLSVGPTKEKLIQYKMLSFNIPHAFLTCLRFCPGTLPLTGESVADCCWAS